MRKMNQLSARDLLEIRLKKFLYMDWLENAIQHTTSPERATGTCGETTNKFRRLISLNNPRGRDLYGNQSNQPHLTEDELIIRRVKEQRSKLFGCAPGAHQLMGFLPIRVSEEIATYATDGRVILVNRSYAESLNDLETRGVILHEVAHIALKHHIRMALWMKLSFSKGHEARMKLNLFLS